MPRNLSPEDTRNLLVEHVETLEGGDTFGEPVPEEYGLFARVIGQDKTYMHKVNRGKRLIALELDMNVGELEARFAGKTILDVGCGEGVLSRELAYLKKTKVTALDTDPEALSHVKESPDLKPVLGSGFDIASAVGDERFDVVIAAYSSTFWAGNSEEKRASILSPIGATASGGETIFVPIISDIDARERNRRILATSQATQGRMGDAISREELVASLCVADWLDVMAIRTLLGEEEQGNIECEFVSSRENARELPLIKGLPPGTSPTLQRYSAIATAL